MKVFLRIAFYGKEFYGTQRLSNKRSIQGEFESLLSRIYNEPVKVTISSRLDRNVHALDFALTFDTLREDISLSHLGYYLQRALDKDVFLKDIRQVSDDFSPRYSCQSKTYLYLIQNSEMKNPLLNPFTYSPYRKIDPAKLSSILSLFQGEHDFAYFATLEDKENTVSTISSVSLEDRDDILRIRFTGKSFLRYQVRFMVGSAIYAAYDKLSQEDILLALSRKKELKSRYKAEPQGLILESIDYPGIEDHPKKNFFLF